MSTKSLPTSILGRDFLFKDLTFPTPENGKYMKKGAICKFQLTIDDKPALVQLVGRHGVPGTGTTFFFHQVDDAGVVQRNSEGKAIEFSMNKDNVPFYFEVLDRGRGPVPSLAPRTNKGQQPAQALKAAQQQSPENNSREIDVPRRSPLATMVEQELRMMENLVTKEDLDVAIAAIKNAVVNKDDVRAYVASLSREEKLKLVLE